MAGYQTQKMARFIAGSRFENIPTHIVAQLKNHLPDALGSILHARDQSVIQKLAAQLTLMSEGGACDNPGALLDGQVYPEQFDTRRITAADPTVLPAGIRQPMQGTVSWTSSLSWSSWHPAA